MPVKQLESNSLLMHVDELPELHGIGHIEHCGHFGIEWRRVAHFDPEMSERNDVIRLQ